MSSTVAGSNPVDPRHSLTRLAERIATIARAIAPPLLFGLRLWASVCLALYVAFWLQLDTPSWAGTSAALVCQPHLGASLRKGWFRMLGTLIGAVAIVMLTWLFPQDRIGFFVALALWGAACALFATLLRNFAAYAAALAGFTAAIIASDQLGDVGGLNGEAFTLAIARASEIIIGIVCAGLVLAATDLGGARRRLGDVLAALSAEIAGGFASSLAGAAPQTLPLRTVRRDLTKRTIALDPLIDEAIGESSGLRYHSSILRNTIDGLFTSLSAWRAVAGRISFMSESTARSEAVAIRNRLPHELVEGNINDVPARWQAGPETARQRCLSAAEALARLPVGTPSARLLADQTAVFLLGLARALNGLALLVSDPLRTHPERYHFGFYVPDWLPPLVNAWRAFIAIVAIELFWVVSAWPSGSQAITWVAISVILFAPRAEEAYSFAMAFALGCFISAIVAAIIEFAVLPQVDTFLGLSIVLGLYLVPVGALMAQPWQTAIFITMVANFIPILSPTNTMTYDTVEFYNNALAIVVGTGAGAFSFRLIPPLSPAVRAQRLLRLTLRDLRRLARRPLLENIDDWQRLAFARLVALPGEAEPLQRAQLLAALSLGTEFIHLRRIAHALAEHQTVDAALDAFANGENALTVSELAMLDGRLASLGNARPDAQDVLRARSIILAITEALSEHASYFGARA